MISADKTQKQAHELVDLTKTSSQTQLNSTQLTSGERGGADLMVQVVFKLDSHECPTMAVGARAIMARLASSVACEMCAAIPCLAAIFAFLYICMRDT